MNGNRKYLLICFFISLFISINTDLEAQNDLNNYLETAAKNNPGLKAKFNEYMAALERVDQAGTLPDPQIMFGYFIQPVETRVGPQKARFSASQMFPWFGALGAKKDVAAEMARSKYEVFLEAKSKLFYDVKSTWYNLYFIRKAINITIENIDILHSFENLALVKVETGKASSADVLRVQIEIADLENQLALLKNNFLVMQTTFNNLLNVEAARVIDLPDRLKDEDLAYGKEALLDSIQSRNHQVLQLQYMQALYQKQEIVAKKAGSPNLMLGMDYVVVGKSSNPMINASESGNDAVVFPMVGISVPLYRKKYAAMIKEAVFMQESTENSKADKVNFIKTMLEKALKDYHDAERRLMLYKGQTERANSALGILQMDYETSGVNFEELLRMERQLLKYKLELEKALSDKNTSIAFVNYLMGR